MLGCKIQITRIGGAVMSARRLNSPHLPPMNVLRVTIQFQPAAEGNCASIAAELIACATAKLYLDLSALSEEMQRDIIARLVEGCPAKVAYLRITAYPALKLSLVNFTKLTQLALVAPEGSAVFPAIPISMLTLRVAAKLVRPATVAAFLKLPHLRHVMLGSIQDRMDIQSACSVVEAGLFDWEGYVWINVDLQGYFQSGVRPCRKDMFMVMTDDAEFRVYAHDDEDTPRHGYQGEGARRTAAKWQARSDAFFF